MFIAGNIAITFHESLWNLLIFIGLYYYVLTRPKPGRSLPYMVVIRGRFFRRSPPALCWYFRVAQLVSLV